MQCFCHFSSPLGGITMAGEGDVLTHLWFDGQKYDRLGLEPDAEEQELPVFGETCRWLEAYFARKPLPPLPNLCPKGTAFQERVWAELLKIPCGETTTYGALAKALGCRSAQAVGGAVGRNPISILIPCHRVVGANGSLTGYAGGVWRKEKLLKEYEGKLEMRN